MNTMKGFYASISSASRLRGSYLEALSEITGISREQIGALHNELGWQQWTEPSQETTSTAT